MLEPSLEARATDSEARLESYRRLADVFHHVLSEQSLDSLLDRIADTLKDLFDYDTLIIYQTDETGRTLVPVVARDPLAEEILKDRVPYGRGITGWAVENREPVLANQAHLDPRVSVIPGTTLDPESFMTIPLIARGSVKGALNIYRQGEDAYFDEEEFELAKRFADAAALALDNAQRRAELELQAQTDSLTGLYNHRHFHERLRSELNRASRMRDPVTVVIIDIDDFKRVNDVFGHGTGDAVLVTVAELLKSTARASDVVCRLGGEEFAIILPSSDAADAMSLASRVRERLVGVDFDPAGRVTVSAGVAQGPEHAANPRELVACAEAAMMTAKARGKDRVVLFEEGGTERPDAPISGRDVRSIAHLKMLQSLSGKLNRLNDVRQIGQTIANELRTLIDYHSCRVYIAEGNELHPIAFRGELHESSDDLGGWVVRFGEGITGRVAQTGQPLLVPNALECEYAVQVPGTSEIEESLVAVPLRYGSRVTGVVVISKLGVAQFDEDDVRLLEVLGGQASVALENARLYEAQRREAEHARALLEFADRSIRAPSVWAIANATVQMAARLLDATQSSVWMRDERTGEFVCAAHCGYVGDPGAEGIIRLRLSPAAGNSFIEGRSAPFVVTPAAAAEYFEIPGGVAPRPTVVAPLHGLEGWIVVRSPSEAQAEFSDEQLRLLANLSYHASSAMERALLYRDQKEAADIANALLEFSRELASADALGEVLQRTVGRAAAILGSPRLTVWLEDPESGQVLAQAQHGYEGGELAALASARIDPERLRPLLEGREPFVVSSSEAESVYGFPALARAPLAVAPLQLEGRKVGAIVAAAPALGGYEFSERKMKLLAGIAHQAQLAMRNAGNFERLERTFLSTIEALANALEAKDEYTSSHARWITDTCLEVGEALDLPPEQLKRLELGALFHDIGKIGIPTDILLKPGPLTEEEWRIVRTHPELGERILAPIEFLAEVRPIVRACHEHYDGSGYPDGLSGEAIPLEARIILVVDAFHAMISDRPYRRRLTLEQAIERLQAEAGREFDPGVVEVFVRLLRERPELAEGAAGSHRAAAVRPA